MQCIITQTLRWAQRRNKRMDVIARYLKMRYHIRMEIGALERRQMSL
jgi:hypothetical protein